MCQALAALEVEARIEARRTFAAQVRVPLEDRLMCALRLQRTGGLGAQASSCIADPVDAEKARGGAPRSLRAWDSQPLAPACTPLLPPSAAMNAASASTAAPIAKSKSKECIAP